MARFKRSFRGRRGFRPKSKTRKIRKIYVSRGGIRL